MKKQLDPTTDKILRIVEREQQQTGISSNQLIKAAKLGTATLAKWKSGYMVPRINTITALLDVLGLELCVRRKKDAAQ